MGNRRRKKLSPKYAALPWNIHRKRREELENSLMIEQLKLEKEKEAKLKAEAEAKLKAEQEAATLKKEKPETTTTKKKTTRKRRTTSKRTKKE